MLTRSYRSGKESGRRSESGAIVTSSMTFLCLYILRWWRQTWDTAPYFTVVNQSEARISTEHGIRGDILWVQSLIYDLPLTWLHQSDWLPLKNYDNYGYLLPNGLDAELTALSFISSQYRKVTWVSWFTNQWHLHCMFNSMIRWTKKCVSIWISSYHLVCPSLAVPVTATYPACDEVTHNII